VPPSFRALICLFLTICAVPQLLAQYYYPKVTAASLSSTGAFSPGQTVVVHFAITPGTQVAAKVEFVYAAATYSSSLTSRTIATTSPSTGTASIVVDESWPDGTYYLNNIKVTDALGDFFNDYNGFTQTSPHKYFFVTPGATPDFQSLKFTVTGGIAQVTPPTITSVVRTSGPNITAGSPMTYTVSVTPGTSTNWKVTPTLRVTPNFTRVLSAVAGSGTSAVTISIPTSTDWTNGTYKLDALTVSDDNSTVGYSSSSSVLATPVDYTVAGGVGTFAYPQLKDIVFSSAGPLGLGDTLTITCTATPGSSPIAFYQLSFTSPDSPSTFTSNLPLPTNNTTGVFSLTIRPDMVDGDYVLRSVTLIDTNRLAIGYVLSGDKYAASVGPPVKLTNSTFKISGVWSLAPTVLTQPAGGTVQAGGSLTLSFDIGPYLVSGLQWYQGQPGDTSTPVGYYDHFTKSYTTPPQYDTTTYWARITTDLGTVDTQGATITVTYPNPRPIILVQPSPLTTVAGTSSSLSVQAYGPGPLTYQWSKDGTPIGGATNARLSFASPTSADAGNYSVTISNANGSIVSSSVAFTVISKPVIMVQPVSVSVPLGGTASFDVTATGGNLSYRWDFSNGIGTATSAYPGAHYVISNVQGSNVGTYTVTIVNSAGQVTSVPVTLTIVGMAAPVIDQLATVYLHDGNPGAIRITASNSPLKFSATGLPLGLTIDNFGLINGSYAIKGTYSVTVTATNAVGSGTMTFQIISMSDFDLPIITSQPQSRTVPLNAEVLLSVGAFGAGPNRSAYLSHQWYFNGAPIPGANDYMLYFIADSAARAGDYTVVVIGNSGSVTSAAAHVIVDSATSAPHFTKTFTTQTVAAEGTLVLSASAAGSEPLTYQWYRSDQLISGAVGATYALANASQADCALYKVKVTNSFGSIMSEQIPVNVQYTVTPENIVIQPGQAVTLSVPAAPGVFFDWYEGPGWAKPIAGATQATFTTPALTATTSYWVYVHNANRAFSPSSLATVTVSADAKSVIGTYFGTFVSGGEWAMRITSNSTGTFLAYWPDSHQSFVGSVTVGSDGGFSVGTVKAASKLPYASIQTEALTDFGSMAGTIVGGKVSGPAIGITGSIDSGTTAAGFAGYYSAVGVGGASGSANVIVGSSGRAFVVTSTVSLTAGASGTLDSSGKFVATATSGEKITVQLGATDHNAAITVALSDAANISFSGLAAEVANTSRLMNLSARANVTTGSDSVFVGFVTAGVGSKYLLMRGVGPSLGPLGISNYVSSPVLGFFDAKSQKIWSGNFYGDSTVIKNTATRVGAFPLIANPVDCAYVGDIGSGMYSLQLSASTGQGGIGIAEIYDADTSAGNVRLVNLSARARTGPGADVLTAGLVIGGNGPVKVLLRGVGPALAAFSVPGYLANPKLVLFDDKSQPIASNTGWGGDPELAAAFVSTGAFGFGPNSKDTAMLVNLAPGLYSVQVQSQDGSSGVAMVEVYEVK
jgi:hypothetical protein